MTLAVMLTGFWYTSRKPAGGHWQSVARRTGV